MDKETVTVDYQKYKSMEYEIDAIKDKRAYIVFDYFDFVPKGYIIGGVEPDVLKLIEKSNEIASENHFLKDKIKALEEKLNKKPVKKWYKIWTKN